MKTGKRRTARSQIFEEPSVLHQCQRPRRAETVPLVRPERPNYTALQDPEITKSRLFVASVRTHVVKTPSHVNQEEPGEEMTQSYEDCNTKRCEIQNSRKAEALRDPELSKSRLFITPTPERGNGWLAGIGCNTC